MSVQSLSDPAEIKSIMREDRWSERHARAYNRYRWLSSRQRWRRLIQQELAGIETAAQVLEVGSGTGFITTILAGCGYRVTGIDLSPSMLKIAGRNIAAAGYGNRVTLSVGDAENLQTPDGLMAAVVSRWVLWTLPHPHRALEEMVRVLAPGGRIICIDGQFQEMAKMARWRAALVDLVLAGRLPGWRSPGYAQVKNTLPRLNGPQVAEVLSSLGLTDIATRELSPAETDGTVTNWLMGSGWRSYLVAGAKPR